MNDRENERVELLAWAKQGIHNCMEGTRGAHMFGSGAEVKAVDNSTLEIRTRDVHTAKLVVWELKLTRKV